MVESTIGQTIELLHRSLQDYIEAAYHVSNETLVAQRKALLEEIGVIHQQPVFGKHSALCSGPIFLADCRTRSRCF